MWVIPHSFLWLICPEGRILIRKKEKLTLLFSDVYATTNSEIYLIFRLKKIEFPENTEKKSTGSTGEIKILTEAEVSSIDPAHWGLNKMAAILQTVP